MIRKMTLSALALIALAGHVAAQQNRIEVSLGGYSMPGARYYDRSVCNMGGLSITRKINDRVSLRIGYVMPNLNLDPATSNMTNDRRLTDGGANITADAVGKIDVRHAYHYWDAGVQYRVVSYRKHALSAVQSISLAHGKHVYLVSTGFLAPPGIMQDAFYPEYETRKEAYLGGVTGLRYDYRCWNKRINIGLNAGARYYFGNFPFQLNYGAHLGFNF